MHTLLRGGPCFAFWYVVFPCAHRSLPVPAIEALVPRGVVLLEIKPHFHLIHELLVRNRLIFVQKVVQMVAATQTTSIGANVACRVLFRQQIRGASAGWVCLGITMTDTPLPKVTLVSPPSGAPSAEYITSPSAVCPNGGGVPAQMHVGPV